MNECNNHDFMYGGVKYKIQPNTRDKGSQAINYFDWFFCRKCLHYEYRLLPTHSTTYSQFLFNATPIIE